jgi:hypothetical protein
LGISLGEGTSIAKGRKRMTQPTYQFDNVVMTLSQISQEFAEISREIAVLDEDYAHAKHAEKIAVARAFMSGEGSMEARRQQAVLDTESESLDVIVAAAKLRAARSRLEYLQMAFDTARSINAAKRAEFMAEPTGQWT